MPAAVQRLVAALRRIHLFNQEETRMVGSTNAVLWNNFRHLVEETGEMAKCLRGTNDEPMVNEAMDAAICALACALIQTGGEITPLLDIMDMKLDKWQGKFEEKP